MESRDVIEESKRDFQSLIREGGLPPKMQLKLRYLLNAIQGNEQDYTLVDELPQFQKMSLTMMDKTTKISLFNSIVKCLAGRQVLIYFGAEKATLKTELSSASSLVCYLFGSSQALKISKNKEGTSLYYQMSIQKLMVSKIYRQQKKQYSFGIEYEGARYRVKFEEEGQCARIHGALLTIIREKRSLKTKQVQKQALSQIKKVDEEDEYEINYQARLIEEEKQYLLSLKKKVVQADLQNTQKFQLVKNTDWGKILANRKENEVNILMFLQVCDVSNLIESYIQFGSWNTQVQSFKVINKIRRNTYLCILLLKRKALTAPRQAFFTVSYFKQCSCLRQTKIESSKKHRQKHYLLLNSVDSPESFTTQKGSYSFTINQIIQFSKVQGENSCIFINLKSKIDFNVYEYFAGSIDKSLDFLEEIGSITLLSRERELLKNNKKQLFQFGYCICQLKIPSKIILQDQTQMNSQMKKSITFDLQSSRKKIVQQYTVGEWQLKEVFQVLDNHNNKMFIEKRILEFIKKKVYEKYYLKQKFDLQCHEKSYIDSQYRLKQIQNFFKLGISWKFNSSEDLVFIEEEIIKMQKSTLKLIIKQITSNIMAGKSILTMSLPVEIFSDDSAIQGFSKIFGFVPYYMSQAVKKIEVVEQIKYVAAAWFFIFACNPQVTKPFNPILGQTYQGIIGGIPVYFQQISHHPPISSFYMKNDKFQAYGNFDIIVDLGMNSAFTKFPSTFTIKIFENNSQYNVRYPDIEVGGIMFGDRILKMVGKSYVLQKNSGTYLQFSIGKAKKGLYEYKQKIRHADLVGGIFQISPSTIQRLQSIEKKKSVQGIKPEQALKKYSVITGKWFGDLSFDGVSIKSFKNGPFPLQMQRPNILLPSDSTYRLDILYKRWKDFKTSNQQKQVLENLQRNDRKAREKNNPKKH